MLEAVIEASEAGERSAAPVDSIDGRVTERRFDRERRLTIRDYASAADEPPTGRELRATDSWSEAGRRTALDRVLSV